MMFKSSRLIVATVMVCFTIMAVNANCVLADDQVEQEILKRAKKIKHILLEQVLPRLGYVPKTGQTVSSAAGDDGALGSGIPWPKPRLTDNGDGTVTDNLTGLMWSKDAQIIPGLMYWDEAVTACNDLVLAGYDDWRLPNIREMFSLISHENQISYASLPDGHPFLSTDFDGAESGFWTSTALRNDNNHAYDVNLQHGIIRQWNKTASSLRAWPVRGSN